MIDGNEKRMMDALKREYARITPDYDKTGIGAYAASLCTAKRGGTQKRASKMKPGLLWAAAACIALIMGFAAGRLLRRSGDREVFAALTIDVNPSLEISVNRNERVIEVIPLNEDAVRVMGDMDFSGSSIELTVNALIGSMYRRGYLNEINNSVLVSLESGGPEDRELLDRISNEISDLLEQGGGGKVIKFESAPDESIAALAEKYGVSTGKAALINELLKLDPSFADESFADISVTNLAAMIENTESAVYEEGFDALNAVGDELYVSAEELTCDALRSVGPEHIGLVKAEYFKNVWRFTSNASVSGEPDVTCRVRIVNGVYTFCVTFTLDETLRSFTYNAVNTRTGSFVNCYQTIEKPADEMNASVSSKAPEGCAAEGIGLEHAAFIAVSTLDGAGAAELDSPLCAELNGGMYYVTFGRRGASYKAVVDALNGEVLFCGPAEDGWGTVNGGEP